MSRSTTSSTKKRRDVPPLPLQPAHWQAIVDELSLSPQQAKAAELLLRGMSLKQIATAMEIHGSTLRTYIERIFGRAQAHNKMELAMRVLALSHTVVY